MDQFAFLRACASICIAFAVVGNVCAASFNCNKATTKSEIAICASEKLSKLDSELAALYKRTLDYYKVQGGDAIRSSQREWLMKTRDKCLDEVCLVQAYELRITNFRIPLEKLGVKTDDIEDNVHLEEPVDAAQSTGAKDPSNSIADKSIANPSTMTLSNPDAKHLGRTPTDKTTAVATASALVTVRRPLVIFPALAEIKFGQYSKDMGPGYVLVPIDAKSDEWVNETLGLRRKVLYRKSNVESGLAGVTFSDLTLGFDAETDKLVVVAVRFLFPEPKGPATMELKRKIDRALGFDGIPGYGNGTYGAIIFSWNRNLGEAASRLDLVTNVIAETTSAAYKSGALPVFDKSGKIVK